MTGVCQPYCGFVGVTPVNTQPLALALCYI